MANNTLREQVEPLHPTAWKWFVQRREALKDAGTGVAAATEQAKAEVVAMFAAGEDTAENEKPADGPQLPPVPKIPGAVEVFERDRFATLSPLPVNKTFQWVAANMFVAGIEPEDAPNSEAWGLLFWCRMHASNMAEFYRQMYVKLIPSKTQLESESKFTDDGRVIGESITRFRQFRSTALLSRSAEGN